MRTVFQAIESVLAFVLVSLWCAVVLVCGFLRDLFPFVAKQYESAFRGISVPCANRSIVTDVGVGWIDDLLISGGPKFMMYGLLLFVVFFSWLVGCSAPLFSRPFLFYGHWTVGSL